MVLGKPFIVINGLKDLGGILMLLRKTRIFGPRIKQDCRSDLIYMGPIKL